MEGQKQKSRGVSILLISIGILLGITALFYLIFNISGINKIFAPIITGLVLAFLLSPILRFYEYRIFVWKKSSRLRKNLCLACSIIMTLITAVTILVIIFWLIIPQFVNSIKQLIDNYDDYLKSFVEFVNTTVNNVKQKFYRGDNYEYQRVLEYEDIGKYVSKLFSSGEGSEQTGDISAIVSSIAPYIQKVGVGIYDVLKNLLIGLFIAVYLLMSKDLRWAQINKFRKAFLTPKQDEFLMDAIKITSKNFNGFIKGKLIDSLIIGLLTFVLFEAFDVSEYNILNATIIGITNIIPVFGPIIGAVPVIFVVLISNPSKFLLTLILILIIQQIDGNIIGPKILGDSTNVSSLTVIIAICVMGGIFGVFGMIIGVPIFATIIAIVKKVMEKRLAEKGEPIDTEEYFSVRSLRDPHKMSHKNENTWIYKYEHSRFKARMDSLKRKFKKNDKKADKNKNDPAVDAVDNEDNISEDKMN